MKNITFCILLFSSILFSQNGAPVIKDVPLEDYKKADLKGKFEMNKNFAIKEALPVLSSYQTIVDEKFAGVKNFGTLVANTNFNNNQDITKLTANNSDYWRATMEMEQSNELIPVTKIFMLISQGEFDHALKYLEIVQFFSKRETYADNFLIHLKERLILFNNQLASEIQKGIVEHDKGEFEKAIEIYTEILKNYPNSAWANFELFYSQSELNNKVGKKDLNSFENWEKIKGNIFGHNPLYNVNMSAKDAREAYQHYRRSLIDTLFRNKDNKIEDIYKYADIAMDMEVYDFAAQLFWYTSTYSKIDKSLYKYLYCLEKLGVTDLKKNFKGNFEKEFKAIDREKEKEMLKSDVYKSYSK